VVLYFVDPSGVSLVSEERLIAGCNEERQCIARTLESLAAGSKTLQALIPVSTRILAVDIDGSLVRINFSRDLVNRHPGGTLSELLTVYGLANTLTVNFPSLERLQILIEGQVRASLKGHVDISRPLKADFSYSHIAELPERDPAEPALELPTAAAGPNRAP
jgi:spore germination protein GerM